MALPLVKMFKMALLSQRFEIPSLITKVALPLSERFEMTIHVHLKHMFEMALPLTQMYKMALPITIMFKMAILLSKEEGKDQQSIIKYHT